MKGKRAVAICISLLLIGSTIFSGCNKEVDNTTSLSNGKNTTTVKVLLGEFTTNKIQMEQFKEKYPNIMIEAVEADDAKLMALIAAGNSPDVWRVSAISDIPVFATRGLLMKLDKYLEESDKFPSEDLMPIQQFCKWDGSKTGSGSIYGLIKDWGPDTTLYINKEIFAKEGLPLPTASKPITYDQLREYSEKAVRLEGGMVKQFGFGASVLTVYDHLQIQLSQLGKSLWNENFSSSNFQDADVKKILQYWVDFSKTYGAPSQLSPFTDGTGVGAFNDNSLAVLMTGYWTSGLMRNVDAIKSTLSDRYTVIPSPVMEGGKRSSTCVSATGASIYSGTKVADASWKFMEWYFGGEPADERAKSGWGLPIFKSKMSMLPAKTQFDQELIDVSMEEINNLNENLRINPYVSKVAINALFDKYLVPVLYGATKLDEAIAQIENEVNNLITEGREIAGIK